MIERTNVVERRRIEERIVELEADNASASGWGAAVGARQEEIDGLRRQLRRMESLAADAGEVERLREAFANAKPFAELPDDIRIPLHSLQADTKYLFGRVAADGSVAGMMANSVLNRLSQLETACYELAALRPAPSEEQVEALSQLRDLLDGTEAWSASAVVMASVGLLRDTERVLASLRPAPQPGALEEIAEGLNRLLSEIPLGHPRTEAVRLRDRLRALASAEARPEDLG